MVSLSSLSAQNSASERFPFTDAGVDYKNIIKADLEKDPRVESVTDMGVNATTDKTGGCHYMSLVVKVNRHLIALLPYSLPTHRRQRRSKDYSW